MIRNSQCRTSKSPPPTAWFHHTNFGAGDLSDSYGVSEVHTNPAVALTANGKSFSVSPVEGFDGFNPRIDPGDFVLSINVSGTPLTMRASLTQPVAN